MWVAAARGRGRDAAQLIKEVIIHVGASSAASKASAAGCPIARSSPLLPPRTGLLGGAASRRSQGRACKRWQSQRTDAAGAAESRAPSGGGTNISAAAMNALRGAAKGAQYAGKASVAVMRAALQSSVGRALRMQLGALWQRHYCALYVPAGLLLIYLIWRLACTAAAVFVNVPEGWTEWRILASACAAVALVALYLRRHYAIDPDAVYRLAMLQLNTNPGVLEVMGAPLQGSQLRAVVQSGGRVYFKGMRPKLRKRRVHMMFPLEGPARQGLVSLEAQKRGGQYRLILLAVDLSKAGAAWRPCERLYLAGNEAALGRSGVLGLLCEPLLQAMSQQQQEEEIVAGGGKGDEVDILQDLASWDGGSIKGLLQQALPAAASAERLLAVPAARGTAAAQQATATAAQQAAAARVGNAAAAAPAVHETLAAQQAAAVDVGDVAAAVHAGASRPGSEAAAVQSFAAGASRAPASGAATDGAGQDASGSSQGSGGSKSWRELLWGQAK